MDAEIWMVKNHAKHGKITRRFLLSYETNWSPRLVTDSPREEEGRIYHQQPLLDFVIVTQPLLILGWLD